jgi:hypothetical protein
MQFPEITLNTEVVAPNPACCTGPYFCRKCADAAGQNAPRERLRLTPEEFHDLKYFVENYAEITDPVDPDDVLIPPVINWQELSASRGKPASRDRHENREPVLNRDDDLLIPPSIDWAAEARRRR